MRSPPLPPVHLGARVGGSHADDLKWYEEFGLVSREEILRLLPVGWTFEGKRVLDFGCGAGRTLRHFLAEAEVAEVYGCDIHAESVQWLQENLCPPLRVFRSSELPPLALASSSLDLVWAVSVFTHLPDTWEEWLLELRRVLVPGGLLIATFLGRGTLPPGQVWDESAGITVTMRDASWDDGGPRVFLSPWWIREHWDRTFEIAALEEAGFARAFWESRKPPPWGGQGVVVARKRREP